ncbi:MAG TPA: CocE/NonD family hydrolase, partial [Pyrinomonadaceae bacterium]|nr:CocE/NonD family hydrolase [Pyrinomonadaceae bacterium]
MIPRLSRLALRLLLSLTFAAQLFSVAVAQTAPAASQSQTAAPSYKNYSQPQYKSATVTSFYVQMRDGVRLAVDLALPDGLPAGTRIPAVVQLTRYWRARAGQTAAGDLQRFFNAYGYAVVTADVRGTGASFGVWTTPWSREEIRDGGDLVDWIIKQPWSSGKVGALGNSYLGSTAQLLAVPNHPAVKAVIPRHYDFDVYTDVAFPGGVFNEWMVKNWDDSNHQLDLQPGVKPVDEDKDMTMLREAVKGHAANIELFKAARAMTFRDDRPFGNVSIDDFSVHTFRKEIEQSKVAINNWGGWLDAGTADGVIR